MADFTFPQLNSDQGTSTAETLRNYANAAANLVCDVYAASPGSLIPPLGDPLGVGAFNQGLMDGLCHPRGKQPPPPTQPFSGGQCVGVRYIVRYAYSHDGTPSGNGSVVLFGKIGGAAVTRAGGTDSYKYYRADITHRDGKYNIFDGGGGLNNGKDPATASIISVTPTDGSPDTCGDPPPVYPPIPDPPPNLTVNAPVTINGSPITIPVTIIPTVYLPNISFRPELNVDVGGINVNISLGGINLSINPTINPPPTSPPVDPRPMPPPPTAPKSPDAPSKGTDLSEVYKRLAEIKACACPVPTVVLSDLLGEARGLTASLPSRSLYVVLQSQPTSANRYQASEGNAPDINYLGWISFGVGGLFGQRISVSFANSAFLVPLGATQVAYSLVFGATGVLRVYYLKDVIQS